MSLDNRQRSIIKIAALEAKGDLDNLNNAINYGLNNGLSINEIKEELSQLYAYTGFPRSLNALGVLQQIIKDRENAGIKSETGKEPQRRDENFDALKEGTKIQTQLCGGNPFNYTFCEAEDYYLKAHLFGDIFRSDILSHQDREIATISALSAIEGLAPQLTAHVAGSRNLGVKDNELKDIPTVLSEEIGEIESYRVQVALSKVLNEKITDKVPFSATGFEKGDSNINYAKFFIGNSYLNPMTPKNLNKEEKTILPMSNVTFEPGCRNNWHVHHGAHQILICVSGEGIYQEWGKTAIHLKTGDVIDIPEGVKHWHGATKDHWFQHIATHVATGGETSNEWLEPVCDEDYNNANK